MNSTGTVTVNEFTRTVVGLLDRLDCGSTMLLPDRGQLDLVAELLGVQSRLAGVLASVLQTVESSEAAMTAHGTTTVSWLAGELRYTRREASAMVYQARDLDRFTQVREALLDGDASEPQARATMRVLRKLPADLGSAAECHAQATMVGYCDQFDSQALAGLSRHLLEVVAPEVAEEAEAKRIERELAAARRNRHFSFSDDGHGSTVIRGSLPLADAALLKEQIDAIASQARRTASELCDPLTEKLTPAMRRADALGSGVEQPDVPDRTPRSSIRASRSSRDRYSVTSRGDRADRRSGPLADAESAVTLSRRTRCATASWIARTASRTRHACSEVCRSLRVELPAHPPQSRGAGCRVVGERGRRRQLLMPAGGGCRVVSPIVGASGLGSRGRLRIAQRGGDPESKATQLGWVGFPMSKR